jgi:hypothetical protein
MQAGRLGYGPLTHNPAWILSVIERTKNQHAYITQKNDGHFGTTHANSHQPQSYQAWVSIHAADQHPTRALRLERCILLTNCCLLVAVSIGASMTGDLQGIPCTLTI